MTKIKLAKGPIKLWIMYYLVEYGYWNSPYEVEARKAMK